MKLSFFKPKVTFCSECGAAFKPVDEPYWDLCAVHRKPFTDMIYRRRRVILWVGNHLEEVEKMMAADVERQLTHLKDIKAMTAQQMQAHMGAKAQAQAANAAGLYGGLSGALGTFGPHQI